MFVPSYRLGMLSLMDLSHQLGRSFVVRLAHRLRDMQTLPYVVVTNPHMSHVYELYYKAFETLRRVQEIKTVDDNDRYCKIITEVYTQLRASLMIC